MNNSLVQAAGLLPSRLDRQVGRALEQIDASTAIAVRRDAARLERITETTQRGMLAVSHLAAVEVALGQATPHAADRLHAVAVAGAIGIVSVVHDAGMGA
jgi:hypothetical protein